jgi:hypothetical protein
MISKLLKTATQSLLALEIPTVLLVICCAVISVAYALTITPGQLASGQFRNSLSNASAQFGNPLNNMRYGVDGVCTAFAYRAQQGFQSLGVPSRIVWADTSVGYHAFNEVYVDTNGDGLGDSWQIYEPQRANGQPFFSVNNVQHTWDDVANAPKPGQGASYAGNGLGGNQLQEIAPGLTQIIQFIMMFQQLKNMVKQGKQNSELVEKQEERFEGAIGNLAATTL